MKGRRERGCGEHRRLGLESFIWAVRPEFTEGGFEGSSPARSGAQRAWVCGATGCVITVSQGSQASTNRPGLRVARLPTLPVVWGSG